MENKCKYIVALTVSILLTCATKAAENTPLHDAPSGIILSQEERDVRRMQKELLGPYHDIRSLTTSNIGHAYIMFMENVRIRQSSWAENDWSNAKAVMDRLDKKSSSLYRMLGVSDRARIKVLQGEFRELQAKSMAKK